MMAVQGTLLPPIVACSANGFEFAIIQFVRQCKLEWLKRSAVCGGPTWGHS
jgi:hypothetical protein